MERLRFDRPAGGKRPSGGRADPPEKDAGDAAAPDRKDIWTVSEITAAIHRLISTSFDDVRVAGEISGWKVWTSGHAYFTLKDSGASIRCAMFRGSLRYLKFRPHDGLAIVARGSVEVRAERGEYQLIVSGMEPEGYGALQLAFEQLKQKLEAEGLFAAERKRPLPAFPRRIGIVTSPKGAVIRDMLTVLRRRWPGLHIRLFPAKVQGEGSKEAICEGLRFFGESGWPDVVIVGRGGGSLEDLWAFNEEAVARAIAGCPVPVVSAVGHETDFTIADFVADLRAPTPSAAAEMIVKSRADVAESIQIAVGRAGRAMHYRLSAAARRLEEQGIQRAARLIQRRLGRALQKVDEIDYDLRRRMQDALRLREQAWQALDRRLRARDLRIRLGQARQRFEADDRRLSEIMRVRLAGTRRRYDTTAARLEALSPLGVLDRGYALVENEAGTIVRAAQDAPIGSGVRVRLRRGGLRARVESHEAER